MRRPERRERRVGWGRDEGPASHGGAPVVLVLINDLAIGGAQRVAAGQAAGLAAGGFDVHVASLESVVRGALLDECRAAGVRVHPLRAAREPQAWAVARLQGLLTRLRPALVHTHLARAGVTGRTCARIARVPRVVSTLHNLSDWEERAGEPWRALDRRTLRWCDAIVAASEAIRRAVEWRDPVLAARTCVIRNGVDVGVFAVRDADQRATDRASFGLDPHHFVIGAVCRLEPRKGIDTLLGAFSSVIAKRPESRLLIVGDGPERAALEAAVGAGRLESVVRFTGERRDVAGCLAAMDVFAAPSRTEGLGLALIEAMASGLPVLGSRVGGIPEVLGDGRCGWLLPADDVRAWSDALVRIAGGPELRLAMGAAARHRASCFSIAASNRALAELYHGLVGGGGAERAAA
jgi:glycosyltransferase involved in cell wall biosynthesis